MPGSSPTMARRDPIKRLKSVDLPTFGRPTMASKGTRFVAFSGIRFSQTAFPEQAGSLTGNGFGPPPLIPINKDFRGEYPNGLVPQDMYRPKAKPAHRHSPLRR